MRGIAGFPAKNPSDDLGLLVSRRSLVRRRRSLGSRGRRFAVFHVALVGVALIRMVLVLVKIRVALVRMVMVRVSGVPMA